MMAVNLSILAQAQKIFALTKPITPLHPSVLCFPVHLFDMVGLDCQDVPTACAARLQDAASPFSLHPLAKAMHTLAAANFRLPRSLG
jgi:hypothetical protein